MANQDNDACISRRAFRAGLRGDLFFVLAITCVGARADAASQQPTGANLDAVGIRLQLGVGDTEPTAWDGQVRLTAGEITRIEPWRMRPADQIIDRSGWKATSYQLNNPPQGEPRFSPTGVIITLQASPGARLDVTTAQGNFGVLLANARPGDRLPFLDGRVVVDRVAPTMQITSGDRESDFPAAATAPDGTVWVTYVAHAHRGARALASFDRPPDDFKSLVPSGGGDQVMLTHFDGRTWSEPMPLSPPGLDVWRPTIAIDRGIAARVIWSQNEDGNWDLFEAIHVFRSRDSATTKPAEPKRSNMPLQTARLTSDRGTDAHAALVSDRSGRNWVAWQAWRQGQAEIWLKKLPAGPEPAGEAIRISHSPANEWSPAIAADSKGRLYIAYDTYQNGNYDVYLRTYDGGKLSEPIAVAASSRFEARPSVTCDAQDRVWIAYEQRAADWGKDFGPLASVQGSPLYMRGSSVQVRCIVEGEVMRPAAEVMQNSPTDLQRLNSFARISFDASGRLWLVFRHRHEAVWGANPSAMMVGGVWLEYATCYDGESWSPPMFLASSDNLLDVRPALAVVGVPRPETANSTSQARLIAIYPSDGRLRHEVIGEDHQRKVFFTGGGVTVPGQAKNELFAGVLPDLGSARPMQLQAADAAKSGAAGVPPDVPAARGASALDPDPEPTETHANFADDLKRIRDYRIESAGKTYQLLRGEFHRHTELSMDGGEDGSLEDMWRYAIDAAALDWIGNGDHDSGGGREYPWWIIQKTTDIYHDPPHFVPMFTYERSVPYPNGHRNCMFDRRGIRTLPRLMGDDPGGVSPEDTKMLYRYLKEMGGICASHTSGTGMGTDWRDNDPLAEPVVEIYQGDRNSYEHLGGPRVARKQGEAIGGWKPLGMIWNAMAMGHKFGFQSSSDHWSTHISYAIAIAEAPSRTAILDAFKKRHCYGATDNIILDVRMGNALMGDEISIKRGVKPEPKLSVRVHGTAPIARVDVIKDFQFAYATESKTASLQFDWTDPDPRPGLNWYYVRVVQTDGQVAWGSPIWLQIPAAR